MQFVSGDITRRIMHEKRRGMRIVKYDPFKELDRFFEDDMFGFFPAVKRHFGPAMDMYETDNAVVVELQVPKIDPSKVSVTVEDGVLKVEGGEEQKKEEEGLPTQSFGEASKKYYRKEIRSGYFSRAIGLPTTVKENETEATFENGVLKITLPKSEQAKPKKIEVKVK